MFKERGDLQLADLLKESGMIDMLEKNDEDIKNAIKYWSYQEDECRDLIQEARKQLDFYMDRMKKIQDNIQKYCNMERVNLKLMQIEKDL